MEAAQGFDFFNNSRNNQIKTNYWTTTNDERNFPRPDASADKFIYASTLGYQDGSFIKVRSINLGYNLPAKMLSKIRYQFAEDLRNGIESFHDVFATG